MEDNVSLFDMRQNDEVDNIMEEIKESVEVSKEEDKIIQEIVNSNVKTSVGTYDINGGEIKTNFYSKQEVDTKLTDIIDDVYDRFEVYDNDIKEFDILIERLEKRIKSIQESNIQNNQAIIKEIESIYVAISSLKQSAANMEHRQNKAFKENLKLKDRLKTMTLRMNITDTILILSIIAYTIRFLTLGM